MTRNAGGTLGAWLSDVLLYLFGLSAYWLVLLGIFAVPLTLHVALLLGRALGALARHMLVRI